MSNSGKPATILDKGNPEYDAFAAAYRGTDMHKNPFGRCLDSFPLNSRFDIDRLLSNEMGRSSPKILALTSQYLGKFNQRSSFLERDGIAVFLSGYFDERWTRSRLSQSEIDGIAKEIDDIAKIGTETTDKLNQLKAALREMSAAVEREISVTSQRADEIDKSLSQLDDRLSSGTAATDKQLIIAVYLMIGALLVLFLGIKFLSNDIALKIVENRSLVEVVSMAFLLLTIIILGTGEKMPKEAIGTLLGSIAGYIFGRKISDSK